MVDLADCPDTLLDSIVAESYHRWGGRRTAIVPSTAEGIDQQYASWLLQFDADIVYSFVDLNDAAVERFHERFAPSALVKHREFGANPDREPNYSISLPLDALSCLTTVGTFLSRPGPFAPPTGRLEVLDSHFQRGTHGFLEENFGLVSESFSSNLMIRYSDILAPLTLISQEALDDAHISKNLHATYVHEEYEILSALAEHRRPLVMLANLSEMYSPYLSGHGRHVVEGLTIVVGDTPEDRIAFWNGIHRKDRMRPYELTQLRVSRDRFDEPKFLELLRRVISTRGTYGHGNRNDAITLESCSLGRDELEVCAELLRKIGNWPSVAVRSLASAAEVVPIFDRQHSAYFTTGAFEEPEAIASTDYLGRHLRVPIARPWHLEESMPPPNMRRGGWMVDLSLEREVDHCRYSNTRHVWMLPRRIRLERSFELVADHGRNSRIQSVQPRPNRIGEFSFAADLEQDSVELTFPEDDLTAIRLGTQNDYEWREFDHGRKGAPTGTLRFAWSATSDKGRYLLGVLQLFESVPDALSVLMDGYWREEIQLFGAGWVDQRRDHTERVITKIRKRLGQQGESLHFESREQIERLADIAIKVVAELKTEIPIRPYSELRDNWTAIAEAWLSASQEQDSPLSPSERAKEEEYWKDPKHHLDASIQYLCDRNVLFQGYGWRCRSCFNRNWVGIASLSKSMICEVCGTEEAAFVSDEWQFRANTFLVDAYRFHGTEPLVWALWKLNESVRSSFYFAPSLEFWVDFPKNEGAHWDAEIDAIAIADGRVFAIEATRSKGITPNEIEKLVLIADRVRPDVMLVVCVGQSEQASASLQESLAERMPEGVEAKVEVFDPSELARAP